MEVVKKSKSAVRDETLWAIMEAMDNSNGFVVHISWLAEGSVIKHFNSQRGFMIEDLGTVKENVTDFIETNLKDRKKK